MKTETVSFDYALYQANCNFTDIETALDQITNCNEKQFAEIKKEKWYHRLYNCVTFSKKGQKRMAEQISSLSQAQQVLMDIIIRLSAQDAQVAIFLNQSIDKIRKLSENDLYLQNRLNSLERAIALGIKKIDDIRSLSEDEKAVLYVCILSLSKIGTLPSPEQQKYADNVVRSMNVEADVGNISEALSHIKEESRRIMAACCLEYLFLNNLSFNISSEAEDFLDEFDLGNKTIRSLKSRILSTFDLRGEDGLIEKYSPYNVDAIPSDFSFEAKKIEIGKIIESVLNDMDHYRKPVAETDDYLVMCSIDKNGHKTSPSPFKCYNKHTGSEYIPFDSEKSEIADRIEDIYMNTLCTAGTLWISHGNVVCCETDGSSVLLIDLDNLSVTEIQYRGQVRVLTSTHIVFEIQCENSSLNELVAYEIESNKVVSISKNIVGNNNDRCLNYCYDVEKLYYITNSDGKQNICSFDFSTQAVEQIYRFSNPINIANLYGLGINREKNTACLLMNTTPKSTFRDFVTYVSEKGNANVSLKSQLPDKHYFDLISLDLNESSEPKTILSQVFIHDNRPFVYQSNNTNKTIMFVTEKSYESSTTEPTFELVQYDSLSASLMTLVRGCGKAVYSTRKDYSKEKSNNELEQGINNILADLQSASDNIYKEFGETPPDHTFCANAEKFYFTLCGCVILNIGESGTGSRYNSFYYIDEKTLFTK